MTDQPYFPESENEILRLENKTDPGHVISQAIWAGLKPGMRVLDVGCGPGVTTTTLAQVAGPDGSAVGVDRSEERIRHAQCFYSGDNVSYVCRNFFADMDDLGSFDFIWVRFVLEYFHKEAFQLVEHIAERLKPGGLLCLVDLDLNCMNHYGLPERLEKTIQQIMNMQVTQNNFDPLAGRKLFSFLYDLGFEDLKVDVRAHHLVYGELSEFDRWNWWHKIEMAGCLSGLSFEEYEGGFEGFEREFIQYFVNPRRFAYTPLILARGQKPL